MWNTLYNNPSDSILVGLLGFHLATKSEAIYYCIDNARAPAILHILIGAGVPVPMEVVQAYSLINYIQQTLNFLNIYIRLEGMIVTTGGYSAYDAAVPNAWLDAMVAKVPGYSRDDFMDYHTGC